MQTSWDSIPSNIESHQSPLTISYTDSDIETIMEACNVTLDERAMNNYEEWLELEVFSLESESNFIEPGDENCFHS